MQAQRPVYGERIALPATYNIDVKELLKAGAHFGHRSKHWNAKMRPYIHSLREGIYILDLLKTAERLQQALEFVEELASNGKQIIFVGTKQHLRGAVKTAATAASMPYVIERWFGGTLTNFPTISQRLKYFKDLETKFETGELAQTHNKRELGEVKEELAKLNQMFGGLKDLSGLPGAIFLVDVLTDKIAVKEAQRLEIPTIGIVDSNADPTVINYPIPANDDAVSSVSLISNFIAEAINRGHQRVAKPKPVAVKRVSKPGIKSTPRPATAKPGVAKTQKAE